MADKEIIFNTDDNGIATITLNRPDIHNAFDDEIIDELIQVMDHIQSDSTVRVVVLRSEGKSFSAGADLRWMRRMADYTPSENKADAMQLATLMEKLNHINKPTIARVQGAAFGGGVGLVACCDIAVASDSALFCLSEVRLGLIPAVISPYVVTAIGERASRRYFMTAERFNAEEALRLELVHEVVSAEDLDTTIDVLISHLLQGGPEALTKAKELIFTVSRQPVSSVVIQDTAERITARRASTEGKEGLNAFLEKRTPVWIKE
ncbi:MAG: methylglutaconyl-CoA hydratase [Cocleimonas sp.]|jgi:methylglutaconyl-CoA hydratase